jgi:hypothetical protein
MIPRLPLLRSRFAGYAIGALMTAIVAGYFTLQVSQAERETARTKAAMSELVAGYAKAAQAQQSHVIRLLDEARAEEAAAAEARVQAEREAADRLREAAREAQREAAQWRARLADAKRDDPSCAAWLAEPVRCPTR